MQDSPLLTPSEAPVDRGYLAYHAPRFRFLLDLCAQVLPSGAHRVLDIGPSPFTALLRQRLSCPVDTLGMELQMERSARGEHHHADLNNPDALHLRLPKYDLIVFAEVLEHLYTSPAPVLTALQQCLTPQGILVLQTPNAASLPKRIKLLIGRNPYELIREDRTNPGHFREYTLSELNMFGTKAGLVPVQQFCRFYFDARYAHHENGKVRVQPLIGSAKNMVYRWLPASLREGITMVFRNGA